MIRNYTQFINEVSKDIINNRLNTINNIRKRRRKSLISDKNQMIDDIKEVIEVTGDIDWINPKATWTDSHYIGSDGKSIRWEDFGIESLAKLTMDMNTIFIYGFGSNQIIAKL